jgi:hypothetical protein
MARLVLPKNDARLWDLPIIKDFVKQVKDRCGGEMGWSYLSRQMQEALIAEKALIIVTGLERGEVPCAAIGCLRRDMILVAGLTE